MAVGPVVTSVELRKFTYEMNDVGVDESINIPVYKRGSKHTASEMVLRMFTDVGIVGEYLGGAPTEYAGIPMLIHKVLGQNALEREGIYNQTKHQMRQHARMGISQIDMALWDIAGKFHEVPVYALLGGYRKNLPCYASTFVADNEPDGLSSPEAYADFAEQCLEMGYPAFKIHMWQDSNIDRQIATVEAVGKRVGDKMDLMLDPGCIYDTFADAWKVGRALDDWGYYWYEDPFRDGGVSAFAHRRLRQMLRTPILQMEMVRGLESHVDFIVADGTDFVRIDLNYDGGITGVMKIAHAAEGFGLDVEPHGPGPGARHCMASMRNSNYYEMGLVHPKVPSHAAQVYLDGYSDRLDSIDENGCVHPPEKPGLGVELDWEFIEKNTVDKVVLD